MGTTITIDIIQAVIYLGMTAAGYLLSHYGVLSKVSGNGTKPGQPTPLPVPGPFNLPPSLQNIAQVFEQQLMLILQQAVKNLLQQQASQPATPAPAPTVGQASRLS